MNFFDKIPVAFLLFLSACSVVTGDFFAKYWSTKPNQIFYWIAILGYLLSGIFYIPTLMRQGLVITSLIWTLMSLIGFITIGVFIFKETLTPIQIIGVLLGISSIVMLEIA